MPDKVRQIIARLEGRDHEAWLVGGSVRDILLGQPPKDWDVVTSANIGTIQDLLQDFRVVQVGARFGTIRLISEDLDCQVSAFRGKDLVQDLARRDFTINSMAWHPRWGLQDPHGGQGDLRDEILRCPGPAKEILSQDALRMMRAARFYSQMGFVLADDLLNAIQALYPLIDDISPERIRDELSLILLSSRPVEGFELLRKTGLLARILPELQECVGFGQHNPHHDKDVFQHTMAVVEKTPQDLSLRLAALLHDIAKPRSLSIDAKGIGHFYGHEQEGAQLAGQILSRLHFDNKTRAKVKALIRAHMQRLNYPEINPAKLLAKVGPENIHDLFILQEADAQAGANRSTGAIQEMRRIVEQALKEKRPFSRADLAISGGDLQRLGLAGPEIGRTLDKLVAAVIKDPTANKREKLLDFAKTIQRNNS